MMNVLADYYNEHVLAADYLYDASAVYKQLDPSTELEVTYCSNSERIVKIG